MNGNGLAPVTASNDAVRRRGDDRPIFPMAAKLNQPVYRANQEATGPSSIRVDRWYPVAILAIEDNRALVLFEDQLYWKDLWDIRILEPISHPAVQARLRAHVELVQP